MSEVVLCKGNFLYKIHKAKRTSSLLSLHGLHLCNLVAEMPKDGGYIIIISVKPQLIPGQIGVVLWNLQDFARRQNWCFSLEVQDIMTSLIAGQESRMFRHYSLKKHTNWYFQTF